MLKLLTALELGRCFKVENIEFWNRNGVGQRRNQWSLKLLDWARQCVLENSSWEIAFAPPRPREGKTAYKLT